MLDSFNTKKDFRHFISNIKHDPFKYHYIRHGLNEFKNNNFDINCQTYKGQTLLHVAVKINSIKLLKMFIEAGVNPNLASENGFTPLHLAIQLEREEMVKFLLKNGADISLCAEFEQSSLHLAVISGNLDIVKCLISNGADLDIVDEKNNYPIDYAIDEKDNEMIEYLSSIKNFKKERIGSLNE